jgi:hypothetical protein
MGAKQALVAAHFPQEPPQSTSVSSWFFTRSEQLASTHTLAVQTALAQEPASVQACPGAQRGHSPAESPQSTSLSPWSSLLSLQVAAAQCPSVQLPEAQFVSLVHVAFSGQGRHPAVPQSRVVQVGS